jgi:hypothetical protein
MLGKGVAVRGRAWLVSAIALAVLAGLAGEARASWSSVNCNGAFNEMTYWKRSQAKGYAEAADHEGYEWGGGCFKLNDRDDTPGAPDSGGEGTDCSGLVFKTWALHADGTAGYRYWDHQKEIHGPYITADYYSPTTADPFKTISKAYGATQYMDAFVYQSSPASAGHVGLIYAEGSGGSDYIIESKGDAPGTGIFLEDYRSESIYRGVSRKAWTPECYPHCAASVP